VAHAWRVRFLLLVTLAACGATAATTSRPRPTTGMIAGLARDHDSGEPIQTASISTHVGGNLQPRVVTTDAKGHYLIDALPPGDYRITGSFAGQLVDVGHVIVKVGDPTYVDLTFTLGRPDPISVDYSDAKLGAIDHYKPANLAPTAAIIEGTINDSATHERIVGASIAVLGPGAGPSAATQLGVSDEEGRFHFDVAPGTYTVSAYYSVNQRQIEARRSEIQVAGAEAVIVPLWIEAQR
jgi:Carboxypeptidase regulatory-like domain